MLLLSLPPRLDRVVGGEEPTRGDEGEEVEVEDKAKEIPVLRAGRGDRNATEAEGAAHPPRPRHPATECRPLDLCQRVVFQLPKCYPQAEATTTRVKM
jgi:hypothetical protein